MRVQIADKGHPHYGEYAETTSESYILAGGEQMLKVILENCPHGTEECFIFKGQVRQVLDGDENDSRFS